MFNTIAVEGAQFGDEGKGKITDYLAKKADIVVRFQGGNNAGHTVYHDGVKHALRALPSGIFTPKVINVIADGVVLNPQELIAEIEDNFPKGTKLTNLLISSRAHLILPYQIERDKMYEDMLKDKKIGTTKNGIGPTYSDKARRISLRVGDLLDKDYLKERLHNLAFFSNKELEANGYKTIDEEEVYENLLKYAEVLKPYISNTALYLNEKIIEGKKVIFEGAQGSLLDLDHGTYPYVTSSSPTSLSIPLNAGIAPNKISKVLAIMKAYMTRVGEGPMPSEVNNDFANIIREKAHEYGTVTHRPRRVGYLDLPILRYTCLLSGVSDIALTLFDVLREIEDLKVVVAYSYNGIETKNIPSNPKEYAQYKPVYKEFKTIPYYDPKKIKSFDDFPSEAKEYLNFIQKELGAPISIISLGPNPEDTLLLNELI